MEWLHYEASQEETTITLILITSRYSLSLSTVLTCNRGWCTLPGVAALLTRGVRDETAE